MKKVILPLIASLSLFSLASCSSKDCDADHECPAIESDAGQIIPPPEDGGVVPQGPSLLRQYLERISALFKKNFVRVYSCFDDENEAKFISRYFGLIDPAITIIDNEYANDRIELKWDTFRPCLDELLTTAEKLDVLADAAEALGVLENKGTICDLMSEDSLLPFLTREGIPQCSKFIEEMYAYYQEHRDELYDSSFEEGLEIYLPYFATAKVELGGECAMDYECKAGFCVGNTPLTCGGICVEKKSEGEHCSSSQHCADGLYCYEGTCEQPAKAGERCTESGRSSSNERPCDVGLYCDDNSNYTCIPLKPVGESACVENPYGGISCTDSYCQTGFAMNVTSATGGSSYVCSAKLPNGSSCDSNRWCTSDFCDRVHTPANSQYSGVCADRTLRFPGEECGKLGDYCLFDDDTCDTSLNKPICVTSIGQVGLGDECVYSSDCLGTTTRCVGAKVYWNPETQTDVVQAKGICMARLAAGDYCNTRDDLCGYGLDCVLEESDEENLDPSELINNVCYNPLDGTTNECSKSTACEEATYDEGNALLSAAIALQCTDPEEYNQCVEALENTFSELMSANPPKFCHRMGQCVSNYVELGGRCADYAGDDRAKKCNPVNSFCGDANEAELTAEIAAAINEECEPGDLECAEDISHSLIEDPPQYCHGLKANYADCAGMDECASGYCDILFGSYMCLDFPDVSEVGVCQASSIIPLVEMMSH